MNKRKEVLLRITHLAGLSKYQVFDFVTALDTTETISMIGLFAYRQKFGSIRTRSVERGILGVKQGG
jgi:hypothetical protein